MQVLTGGETEFDGLMYGDKHPGTMGFLQSQLGGSFSNTLTDVGKQMYSTLGQMFEQFNGSHAMQLVKSVRRKVVGMFEQDVIKPLFEIEEIQQATLNMQRWIMAQPQLRQLYHDQRCDGFSTSYVDYQPDSIGVKHYDYRRVMDGLATEDEDGTLVINHYYDEDFPDDAELSLQDKVDVINTWDRIKQFLDKGEFDPTSKLGERL